jgi:purine-nucleoside phosphorylase
MIFILSKVVVIQDHIALANLTGMNPLLGPKTSPNLPRFLPLSDAYSPSLRRLAFLAAHHLNLPDSALAEGVYAWVSGPTYETAAEGRFLRKAGADLVGMSTVPEVLAAREEGLNVMVLSLATNFVVIPETYRSIRDEVRAEVRVHLFVQFELILKMNFKKLAGQSVELQVEQVVSHDEVLTVGKEKAVVMMDLIQKIVSMTV